jgi:predicted membrane protein
MDKQPGSGVEKRTGPPPTIQNKSPTKSEGNNKLGSDEMMILKILIGLLKYAGGALLIWFVGWFGFGFTWIIIGSLIFTMWMKNQEKKTAKKTIARDVAKDEEMAVEARIDELPAWVGKITTCYYFSY